MKLGSELKVPFEPGELVQVSLFGKPVIGPADLVLGEVTKVGEDDLYIRWGSHSKEREHRVEWWEGPVLVRPAIRGYPYERKLSNCAWTLLWIWYLPYQLRRRLCRVR